MMLGLIEKQPIQIVADAATKVAEDCWKRLRLLL
jgi:hypothetical protein